MLNVFCRHLDQLTMFLLEAEDVNAVDLAMAFAPLLFRIDTGKYDLLILIGTKLVVFFFFSNDDVGAIETQRRVRRRWTKWSR